MTSLDLSEPATAAGPSFAPRGLVVCLAAGALGSALWLSRSVALPDMDAALVLLLRFMAVLKAATALVAFGLAAWRTARPIGTLALAGYALGVAAMAAAPVAIWSLAHVALGAGLFHLGLLAFLVTAWGDDDGLRARLGSRAGSRR